MFDVQVVSDLKDFGRTEDGERFIGEVIYVVVTFPKGDRFVHGRAWDGVRCDQYDEGVAFVDVRPAAYAAAEALAARVRAAATINLAHWLKDRPAYGSEAYLAYGQADDLAWEKEHG